MDYRKDLIPLSREFPFDYFEIGGALGTNPVLHIHDCLEINCILSGNGFNYIENQKFPLHPGEIYIINNLERHIASSEDHSLRMVVIVFDPIFIWQNNTFDSEYLKPFFNRNVFFSHCIGTESPISKQLAEILKEIGEEWSHREEGYRLVIKSLLMKMLAILYRNFNMSSETTEDIRTFQKSYDRIRHVVDYIHDNLQNELNLDGLARVAMMNRTYFSMYFKKVMKINVSDYIETARINKSMFLLKSADMTVTDICYACGFNNIAYFDKVFKKLASISPNEYRFQKQNKRQ